jgi:hypothetical protein
MKIVLGNMLCESGEAEVTYEPRLEVFVQQYVIAKELKAVVVCRHHMLDGQQRLHHHLLYETGIPLVCHHFISVTNQVNAAPQLTGYV